MEFQEHYDRVLAELADLCAACGRRFEEVTVVAVSKTVGIDAVASALQAGCNDFGENRPDVLAEKASEFPQANWHFIGNIQSRINAAARALGKIQPVLLEVNISGEASKSGMTPEEACDFAKYVNSFENLRACGLMTMAPQGDRVVARQCFEALAALRDAIQQELPADEASDVRSLTIRSKKSKRNNIHECSDTQQVE